MAMRIDKDALRQARDGAAWLRQNRLAVLLALLGLAASALADGKRA